MAGGDITWRASLNDDPFRSSMDKIVGYTDQKGKMAVRMMKATGIGMASAFGMALKGIDEYAQRNIEAAAQLDQVKRAWSDMWAAVGEGVYASGILDDVRENLQKIVAAYRGLQDPAALQAMDTQIQLQREHAAQLLKDQSERRTWMAMSQAGGNSEDVARLQALERYESEMTRINAMAKEMRLSESDASFLRVEAMKRREIEIGAARGRASAERDKREEDKRRDLGDRVEKEQGKAAHYNDVRNSLDAEREMLRVDVLKRKGMDEQAALLENEIKRRKELLDLAKDENLTASDAKMLQERANYLFDARAADIKDQRMGQTRHDFKAPSLLYDTSTYRDLYGYQGGGATNVMVETKTQTMTQKQMLKALESIDRKVTDVGGSNFQ